MNIAIPIILGFVIFIFAFLICYFLRRCFFDRKSNDKKQNKWTFDCFDWVFLGISAIIGLMVGGMLIPWTFSGKVRQYSMRTPQGMVSNLYSPTQPLGSPRAQLSSPVTMAYPTQDFPTPPIFTGPSPMLSSSVVPSAVPQAMPSSPDYSALIEQAASGQ